MKQYSLIFSFVLFSTLSFSQNFAETFLQVKFENVPEGPSMESIRQNFRYDVYPLHIPAHSTSKTKLAAAKLMSDLMKEYPSSWLSDYVSTEISVVSNGETKIAKGIDGTLSKAQKLLLKAADFDTKIAINIKYEQENAATRKIETHNLDYLIAVVPDIEASYSGGREALKQYLKKNVLDRISDADLKELNRGSIEFTINKKGQVEATQLIKKTGKPAVDQLLLKAIDGMPQWEPAKTGKGIPVKQQFEFEVGNSYGGC
jgi:TonB family protein